MLIYDKHVPLRLIICNKIQTITFQSIFNMLRLPIRSRFYLYVTRQVTRPLPPGAHCSIDTWKSEDRNNPGNSGNAKAEYNVLLTAQLFSTQKRKRWRKLLATKYIQMSRRRGERGLSKLRKLCKLHTFTIFFSFCYSASSRGHSDTGLYPLPGPATFLTFYFFKRLSISTANAASSGKQYFQSR